MSSKMNTFIFRWKVNRLASLREKKKLQNQKNIIQSARRMFSEQGFQKTTMVEIAKDAEVGTGTIYNYYPSKGALLLAIFSEEMEQLQSQNVQKVSITEGNMIDTLSHMMTSMIGIFKHYPKKFWREMMHVLTEEVEESIYLRKGMFGMDEEMVDWMRAFIESHSKCFSEPIHAADAAMAIYSSAMTQTLLFIYNDGMTYEQLLYQLDQQIRFIFSGKMKKMPKE